MEKGAPDQDPQQTQDQAGPARDASPPGLQAAVLSRPGFYANVIFSGAVPAEQPSPHPECALFPLCGTSLIFPRTSWGRVTQLTLMHWSASLGKKAVPTTAPWSRSKTFDLPVPFVKQLAWPSLCPGQHSGGLGELQPRASVCTGASPTALQPLTVWITTRCRTFLKRREWLLTSVFWPGEFHGLYSPWNSPGPTTEVRSHSLR